ncbi:MAG: 8-oxoguanine deaminase [Candidatus Eisenbacteria bacterium]|nr:8-oxoguanine deaminase [Candidatus Eisenbacteria bacterium]
MILLRNIYHLATMNDAGDRLSGVDVLIDGRRIAEVARSIEVAGRAGAAAGPGRSGEAGGRVTGRSDLRVIDCSSMVAAPGFVNLHHHFYQTLQRNVPPAQNRKLFDWLTTLYDIWSGLTVEAVRASTRLACAELLLTGCTMSSDHMYVFPKGLEGDLIGTQVAAARELGIRFHPTRGSMSLGREEGGLPPGSVVQSEEEILADSERVIDEHHDPEPFSMTRVALAPCSPFSVTDALMEETAELARGKGVLLHTHVAETEDEIRYCLETYGVRPLALMERFGWTGRDVWFAHGVHLAADEIRRLAATGTAIAHCPTSNMRLSSGVAPVPQFLEQGVRVGLAVDGSASNDTSDMLGELRNCLLVHLLTGGPDAVTAEDVARMATRGGADVLGRVEAGSIEEGKAADVVLFDMNRVGYAGAQSDPLAALLYAGFDHRVDYTIVNGEIVVEEGQLVTGDEREIAGEATEISFRMLEAAGVDTPWPLVPPGR